MLYKAGVKFDVECNALNENTSVSRGKGLVGACWYACTSYASYFVAVCSNNTVGSLASATFLQ
jgi:hypothetical protein